MFHAQHSPCVPDRGAEDCEEGRSAEGSAEEGGEVDEEGFEEEHEEEPEEVEEVSLVYHSIGVFVGGRAAARSLL